VEGFILFGCIVVVVFIFLRRLRAREIEAFLDAEMSAFDNLTKKESAETDPILARAHEFMQRKAEIAPTVTWTKYELKPSILEQPSRDLLNKMLQEIGLSHCILTNISLSSFVIRDAMDDLQGKRISFLICDQDYASVIAGIEFQRAGVDLDFIRRVFEDIDRPLIVFPFMNQFSWSEVREKLSVLQISDDQNPSCPKCGRGMTRRKAVKGKQAGRQFWVCDGFPDCRGVVKS